MFMAAQPSCHQALRTDGQAWVASVARAAAQTLQAGWHKPTQSQLLVGLAGFTGITWVWGGPAGVRIGVGIRSQGTLAGRNEWGGQPAASYQEAFFFFLAGQ